MRSIFYRILLFLIITCGFTLRVWDINHDRGMGSHPDERWTTSTFAVSIRLPESVEQFWEPTQSRLNPLWDVDAQQERGYTYGHFPLYLGVAMSELFHWLAPYAEQMGAPATAVRIMAEADRSWPAKAVAGRLTIALLDTWTIFLLYLLGKRMYGRGAGVLAAAFYAFTAQAIQLSHFFAMDPASTTFTVLAVLGGVMMLQDRTWRAALITGLGAGLAISSKFSALPILAVPVVAGVVALLSPRHYSEQKNYLEEDANDAITETSEGRAKLRVLLGIPLAIFVAVLAFCVTSPYAVLDAKTFLTATLINQGRMVRGIADMPFTRQYRNTTPYLYFIEQQLAWGLWWPLGLVCALGTLHALFHLGRTLFRLFFPPLSPSASNEHSYTPHLANVIVWSWVIPYFGLTGAFLAKFNRYMSPLLPFVALWGAGLLFALWQARSKNQADTPASPPHPLTLSRIAAIILAIIGLSGSIFWSLAYVNGVYRQPHPWITAAYWMKENVPTTAVTLCEQWDDCLPMGFGAIEIDQYTDQLRHQRTDWGPYEEDTAEKYQIMKEKLRAADYVIYSSKRIWDSVDELPERYPMTNLYYRSMFSETLGFELVFAPETYPQLFGFEFPDKTADESWSLYDHAQPLIFKKVRQLNDGEFDAIFAGSWEGAKHWDRGEDSVLSPLFSLLGLGNAPESESAGMINRIIRLAMGEDAPQPPPPDPTERKSLMLERPLVELPIVDNYRWNEAASARPWLAIAWWWLVITLLGWLAWPLSFFLFRPLRDRGFLFSRALGWLLAGWLLWILASVGILYNTVRNAWLAVIVLAILGILAAVRQRSEIGAFLRRNWGLILASEALFAVAYLFFVLVRMGNPDLWQPWNGGEKFMEFAFVNGILRSPTFPPIDPHFAGGYINYYYFGLYLVAYLIKLTGIYAEVAFNLIIPTLFAVTVVNTFGVVYSAIRGVDLRNRVFLKNSVSEQEPSQTHWTDGFGAALLAPIFVTLIGNLDGFALIVRQLAQGSTATFQSALPGLQSFVQATTGLRNLPDLTVFLGGLNYWTPSRVINRGTTINEFPYWSFLFADLHPHLISIALAPLALALFYVVLVEPVQLSRKTWLRTLCLLLACSLLLGTLASVNLWELPTYLGLGLLAYLVAQFRQGQIHWWRTGLVSLLYVAGAYLFFLPFFRNFVGVAASGVGLVQTPDDLGQWLLIWGFLGFVVLSWMLWEAAQPMLRTWNLSDARLDDKEIPDSSIERWLSLLLRRFDRLPRLLYLHRLFVEKPGVGYLAARLFPLLLLLLAALVWWRERTILALCLAPLGLAWLLLWRRGAQADAGSALAAVLGITGLAILAGTQVIYLKDFLSGGDFYRMNTLFKFFSQVWVIWGIAAAIGVARMWGRFVGGQTRQPAGRVWRMTWAIAFVLLFAASFVFVVWGTPARIADRFPNAKPPLGTLNALDYMLVGIYNLPNGDIPVELQYDRPAIDWLNANIRGNLVIAESSDIDYYRAHGTRAATMTGLSGPLGQHKGEQHYADSVGERDTLYRDFWSTPDPAAMSNLMKQLEISLIYVGQLERARHLDAVLHIERMAAAGQLETLYQNERTTIYAVPGKVTKTAQGFWVPASQAQSVANK